MTAPALQRLLHIVGKYKDFVVDKLFFIGKREKPNHAGSEECAINTNAE